jgi:hypothetical protein
MLWILFGVLYVAGSLGLIAYDDQVTEALARRRRRDRLRLRLRWPRPPGGSRRGGGGG